MIPFLDLKNINLNYKNELTQAFNRVLESGWFIMRTDLEAFEMEFAEYCEVEDCIGAGNGADDQGIHFSDEAKQRGAFDLLINYLLNLFKDKKYFYFGISTENNGQYLNENLISFKESFLARAALCCFYKIKL